jgi:SET family sugar efflux transporter-like MFS transporter
VTTAEPQAPSRLLIPASALLWGLQFAFLNPAIGIILVTLYDATPGEVGLALAAYNVSGFLSTLVVPTRADRSGDYLVPMLWCGALTVALTSALALSTTLPPAVLALVALGGPAGVGIGLLFAHQRSAGASVPEMMRVRAVFSFSWVAGPPLAAFLMGLLGNRSVLWAIAGVAVVGMGITWAMIRGRSRGPSVEAPGSAPGDRLLDAVRRRGVPLLVVALVLLMAAGSASVSALPLFVTQQLGLDVIWSGVALGLAAGLEIPVLLVLGRASSRFGQRRLVAGGCVAGVAYFGTMTWCGGPVVLLAAQPLNAVFVAAVSGLGLTLVQDVVGRPGLASGLFMNTTRVGAIIAGPVLAVGGVRGPGYSGVFAVCAALVVVGLGLLVLERRRRRGPRGRG